MDGPGSARCPLCGDPAPPGSPCPPGGNACPRCGSVLWPESTTKPRAEVWRYFVGPQPPVYREIHKSYMTLGGCLADLEDVQQKIEDERRRPRPSRLARWLGPLLRLWRHLLVAREARPTLLRSSGVWDPWID